MGNVTHILSTEQNIPMESSLVYLKKDWNCILNKNFKIMYINAFQTDRIHKS